MRAESAERRVTRCAIYTRKSTEEGLDQEFNSLDAQREACAAYILSQRHEGWTLSPEAYDDGGFSGGNMERPGIKRLMAEVAAKRVDVIVVYKVDRLTRSLGDFAKIVDVLDAAGASFVSVTQSFNTTTSMGRLTLNVLLSFAQFEREVTGERIRDKIAASKKKGMWMGGSVPLGYDVVDKKLLINAVEAETVRHIYQRYVEVRSLVDLAAELASAGIVSKQRVCRSGRLIGGTPYWVGGLANLLRNRTYLGQILHKGTVHQGEHDAIISEALWEAAQATFAANRIGRKAKRSIAHKSLLTGLLYDAAGRLMIADHAVKGQRRYRYYMSRRDGSAPGAMRIPAGEIERLVLARLAAFLESGAQLDNAMTERDVDPLVAAEAIKDCADLAGRLATLPTVEQSDIVAKLVRRIDIESDRVAIAISAGGLTRLRGNSADAAIADDIRPIGITVAVAFKKRGVELRMVVSDVEQRERRDPALIALIARAFAVRQALEAGAYRTMEDCGAALGHTTSHLARLLRISFLSPALVSDILHGRQPVDLTAATLQRQTMIGLSWNSGHNAQRLGR